MSMTNRPRPAGPPPFFHCDLEQRGRSAAWLRLRGELDLASGWYLAVRLEDALADAHLVMVDLRELTFIDSAGLGVIVAAQARARASRRRLMVIRGPVQVERLMAVTGLIDRLDFSPLQLIHAAPAPSTLPRRA